MLVNAPQTQDLYYPRTLACMQKLLYLCTRNERIMSVRTLSEAFGARDVGLFILNTDLNTLQDKLTIEGGNLNEIIVWGECSAKLMVDIVPDPIEIPNIEISF